MSTERSALSAADAAWLRMDRPTNLMVINAVLRFDRRIDRDRLCEVALRRLVRLYPRFGELAVDGRLPFGPHWEPDPDFDPARHLHHIGLPEPRDESALASLIGELATMPLDRSRPLWEMHLVDGPGPGSSLIVRMHHCIADGISLARVMLSITDAAPDAPPEPGLAGGRAGLLSAVGTPLEAIGDSIGAAVAPAAGLIGAGSKIARVLARQGIRLAADPRRMLELPETIGADAQTLRRMLFASAEEPNVLKGDEGAARAVAWTPPVPLGEIKSIARAQEATVNDVLLAAVSGALRGYVLARGEDPAELHSLVPFNLRPLDSPIPRELGNRFGLVTLALPVDVASRRERLRLLRERMDEIKHSPEPLLSYAVLEAIGLTPPEVEDRIVDVFTARATAVTTNVPGPRETVYLAGSRLRSVLVWAPTAGSVGTSVSIFSYGGSVTVGLLVHARQVPDPQAIIDRVRSEISAMARLAPAQESADA